MIVISFPSVIFQRLSVQITVLYALNILHAVLCVDTSPTARKRDHSLIMTKNIRNFTPVGDIWTFKRPKHCILRMEHTARCIKSRIKPNKLAKRGHSFDFVEK
jgi:hypothetical protein